MKDSRLDRDASTITAPDDPALAAARAIESVAPLIADADELQEIERTLEAAVARGHFTPGEDQRVRAMFHDYLSARAVVLQAIEELRPIVARSRSADPESSLRAFFVAFAGACLLVRVGRAVVDRFAAHPIVRRKLDEADPERGIPRKQLTKIYRSLTSPRTAWRLRAARQFATDRRMELERIGQELPYRHGWTLIQDGASSLDVPVRDYAWGRLRFRWYSWCRRRASLRHRALFGLLEITGRAVANARSPWYRKRVNASVRDKLTALLQPGDVIVTRHHDAMSNLFLPGYWPHAALHIGTPTQRDALDLTITDDRRERWSGEIRVLEARKDGVRLRVLADTLAVDAVTVIRPQLDSDELRAALERALAHEGKLYDFAFDFFRADRLVCTEVVYRAYDEIGPIRFTLTERAGRPTLSAEDLLDMALRGDGFDPVAVFGTPETRRRIALGTAALDALAKTRRT